MIDPLDHEKLVHKVAQRFRTYCELSGAFDYDDLSQEGFIGLMLAIKGFDPNTGHRFSSYAFPVINGTILRFLRNKGIALKMPSSYTLRQRLNDHSPLSFSIKIRTPGEDRKSVELGDTIPRESDLSGVELLADLHASGLTDSEKAVVRMRIAGKTQVEIANTLGLTRNAVVKKINDTRRKLSGAASR